MTEYQRWLKKVCKVARRQGWDVSRGKHTKFKSPDGKTVSCSLTPTNGYQVKFSVLRDLRRAGFNTQEIE